MKAKPRITIVGPGNLGSALALALHGAGYAIREIVSRDDSSSWRRARSLARAVDAQAKTLPSAECNATVIWLCVPDREIATCAQSLLSSADWSGKIVFHSSGALGSDELRVLRGEGALVASVHPLMTFVRGVRPSLKHVPFAMEGEAAALRVARGIARQLGGEPFVIHKRQKPAYHAWGAFTSPLLVSLLVAAEKIASLAGLPPGRARKMMLPILRQTIENYGELGPAGAFSGPIVRGDAATVRSHLQVLSKIPEARRVYLALARAASCSLPGKNRKLMEKMLRE